jgi:ABC-type oligopeptide transport system ATPase subunit
MAKIVIKNLYKIFGKSTSKALSLLKSGKTKEEIYEATGMTVGVQDASFEVEKGEIFVVMGLSGSGKSTLVRMLNRLIEPTSGEVLVDVHIYITEQGKELLAQAPSPPEGQLSNTLSKLKSEQLENLETSLQVFIDALNFEDVKASTTPIPENSQQ